MAALAYINLVIMTAFAYASAHNGFGKHRVDILPTFTVAMFWFYMYQICYKTIGGLTKLCFCMLYLRLFDAKKAFCQAVAINAGIIAAGTLAFTFGTIFQCLPIHRNWDRRVEGYCLDFAAFWYSHAVFNTAMDIVVFALPIPQINTLQMKQRTKTGLIAVFALGAFTIAASIVRMVLLKGSANSTDTTYGSTPALIWTEIEANTSVICCCLPALRVFFVQVWRSVRGKTGPETPSASDALSEGRQLGVPADPLAMPDKQATMFSQVRYSPPATSVDSFERDGGVEPGHYSVLDRLGLGKRSGSSESDGEGNGSPSLELGSIKKSTDFKHHSMVNPRDDKKGNWTFMRC